MERSFSNPVTEEIQIASNNLMEMEMEMERERKKVSAVK
jgi:hypothetical protein